MLFCLRSKTSVRSRNIYNDKSITMFYSVGLLYLALCGIAYTSIPCYPGCKRHSCDYGGWCNSECTVGYAGVYCDTCKVGYYKINALCCPTNCESCLSDTSCYSCDTGYHGKTCQTQCSAGCKTHSCDKSTGNCTDGCVYGRWGEYCNSRCPSSCTSCSSNNTCNSCVAGYYGTACQFNCSRGCERNCHEVNGSCVRTCARSNGTCTHGCTGGYKGHNCTQAPNPTQPNNTGVIAGTVAGFCVLIVIAVIVVFISIPRRRKGRLDANEHNSTKQETNTAMDVIAPVYENIAASA